MINNRLQRNGISAVSIERKAQGATRENILRLLRRHGEMTAIELSETLSIGAVGIRQHLALLERDGLVQVSGLRRSVGRPSHLYMLTPEAERYFPKAYNEFAVEILDHVLEHYGQEGVEQIIQARYRKLVEHYAPRMRNKTRAQQIAELAQILSEQGYMCEYEQQDDGSFLLTEHNCPLDCIARNHRQLCDQGILMYEELLGVPITRLSSIAEGDIACRYHIPA